MQLNAEKQLLFGYLLSLIRGAISIAFPNNIIEPPRIDCMVDNIKMTVETSQGNPSHMFVKGRHHEPPCVTRNTNTITIRHEQCGLQRERSLNPAGVYYRVCIVVQLHPQFITKVDKTYCASCFYMEAVKELTQELGVSMLSSTEVAISFPMPQCSYTIRRGSPTGPEIRFATVGEPVYHVWSCPSDAYGMLVQNCYVDDGQGNRILIIDQNGCGVDRYIIQTPNYNEELSMAFQESHVFKFADKTITRFTCQIKVCIKAGGTCEGITPPFNCPNLGGGRPIPGGGGFPQGGFRPNFRSPHFAGKSQVSRTNRFRGARDLGGVDSFYSDEEDYYISRRANATLPPPQNDDVTSALDSIDISQEVLVLEDLGRDADRELYEDLLNSIATGTFKRPLRPDNAICVPTMGFALMLILFSILILVGLTTTTMLLLKTRGHKRFMNSGSSTSTLRSEKERSHYQRKK